MNAPGAPVGEVERPAAPGTGPPSGSKSTLLAPYQRSYGVLICCICFVPSSSPSLYLFLVHQNISYSYFCLLQDRTASSALVRHRPADLCRGQLSRCEVPADQSSASQSGGQSASSRPLLNGVSSKHSWINQSTISTAAPDPGRVFLL